MVTAIAITRICRASLASACRIDRRVSGGVGLCAADKSPTATARSPTLLWLTGRSRCQTEFSGREGGGGSNTRGMSVAAPIMAI
jgi:hypothetical protein